MTKAKKWMGTLASVAKVAAVAGARAVRLNMAGACAGSQHSAEAPLSESKQRAKSTTRNSPCPLHGELAPPRHSMAQAAPTEPDRHVHVPSGLHVPLCDSERHE